MSKVSQANRVSEAQNPYTPFGKYDVNGISVLSVPNNIMTISAIGENKFSYVRKNTQDETIKKIINTDSDLFQIELAPLLPLYDPSYKTDFFFLRFMEQLLVAEDSSANLSIPFPIEIGLYLVGKTGNGLVDSFSCDPANSRFALYGTPEEGRLCKYAQVSYEGKCDPQPYVHAEFEIRIINELEEAASVGKIVFPASDHDLYFDGNKASLDGLVAKIKNRVGLHVIETIQNPISKPDRWALASRAKEKTDYKYSMERGFD